MERVSHPYKKMSDYAFWMRSIANKSMDEVDPVVRFPLKINKKDRIVTAGSCFAQHISKMLKENQFNFYVTEKCHPLITKEISQKYNYDIFSARYGNVYTSRQLVQLFQRAYGLFQPQEDIWEKEGVYIDPFRPNIQPGGYKTLSEYRRDREQHFECIRNAFENLDVFIFTLGLTEVWSSRIDGAVFPLCPGVAGGVYDTEKHQFSNLGVEEIIADMNEFFQFLFKVNPAAKVILTVSPVPLMATAEDRSVLVSTTYSKSVLRVACELLTNANSNVYYFPAYEIITGNFSRGTYYNEDLRSVNPIGVNHVMKLFKKHVMEQQLNDSISNQDILPMSQDPEKEKSDRFLKKMNEMMDVMCDEEMLDI